MYKRQLVALLIGFFAAGQSTVPRKLFDSSSKLVLSGYVNASMNILSTAPDTSMTNEELYTCVKSSYLSWQTDPNILFQRLQATLITNELVLQSPYKEICQHFLQDAPFNTSMLDMSQELKSLFTDEVAHV